MIRGRYDEKELNETYIGNVHRHDLIYKYYCKYGSKKALGFCCSKAHAEEMAKEFLGRIPSRMDLFTYMDDDIYRVAITHSKDNPFKRYLDFRKEFFATGTNWKDLDTGITYEKYCSISDKEHIKKILHMPVHFLQESGKGFFVKKEGTALALKEDLTDVILQPAFGEQMKDVIECRAMDYYRRRYDEKR